MSIARVADVDANGAGTSGTVRDNAWKTSLYDQIDARWTELVVTATGSQNNLSITSGSVEADVLLCGNASALTLTGIAAPASPAKPGKRLVIMSTNTGSVSLANNSGSSSAANRIITPSGQTIVLSGATGRALLVYNDFADLWYVVSHDQGAPASHATTLAASSGTFTSAAATMNYLLRGREVEIEASIVITTIGTAAGHFTLTLPFASKAGMSFAGTGVNASTPFALVAYLAPSSSSLLIFKYDGTVPTTGNHTLAVKIRYSI